MVAESYSVVFSGEIADGKDEREVREDVARAFKLKSEQVQKLFSGRPVALKRGLDKGQAIKYRNRLARAGALGKIVVSRPKAEAAASAASSAATPAPPSPSSAPASAAARAQPAPAAAPQADVQVIDCPRCGHEQAVAQSCERCGTDLRMQLRRLEKRRRRRLR